VFLGEGAQRFAPPVVTTPKKVVPGRGRTHKAVRSRLMFLTGRCVNLNGNSTGCDLYIVNKILGLEGVLAWHTQQPSVTAKIHRNRRRDSLTDSELDVTFATTVPAHRRIVELLIVQISDPDSQQTILGREEIANFDRLI
jgi:hypothetical protein